MRNILHIVGILFLSLTSMAQEVKIETEKIVKSVTEKNGITLQAELEKKVFDSREKINMKITIGNNAEKEIRLDAPKTELYKYRFVLMQMKNKKNGTEVPFTAYGDKKRSMAVYDSIARIKPKEEYSFIYELDRVFDLSLDTKYSLDLRLPYFLNNREMLKLENIEFEIKEKDIVVGQTDKVDNSAISKETADGNNISIRVDLPKKELPPDECINLKITIKNRSKTLIVFGESNYYHQASISVKNKDTGADLPNTIFGKKAVNSPVLNMKSKTINSGEEYSFSYNLNRIFDLSTSGTYLLNCRADYVLGNEKQMRLLEVKDFEFIVKDE